MKNATLILKRAINHSLRQKPFNVVEVFRKIVFGLTREEVILYKKELKYFNDLYKEIE